jgi:hypothetical protein
VERNLSKRLVANNTFYYMTQVSDDVSTEPRDDVIHR